MNPNSKVHYYWIILLWTWALALSLVYIVTFNNDEIFKTCILISKIFYLSFNCICFYIQSRSEFTWKLFSKFVLQFIIGYIVAYIWW